MLHTMSSPRGTVGLRRELEGVQCHVDGFVSDRMQQNLKALLVVESYRLVQVVLIPEGYAVPPPTYGSNIAAVFASTVHPEIP